MVFNYPFTVLFLKMKIINRTFILILLSFCDCFQYHLLIQLHPLAHLSFISRRRYLHDELLLFRISGIVHQLPQDMGSRLRSNVHIMSEGVAIGGGTWKRVWLTRFIYFESEGIIHMQIYNIVTTQDLHIYTFKQMIVLEEQENCNELLIHW